MSNHKIVERGECPVCENKSWYDVPYEPGSYAKWVCVECGKSVAKNSVESKETCIPCSNPENPGFRDHAPATCTYCAGGTEIERLRKAVRWAYLTLGYYKTKYNYDPKNITYSPITGKEASGIMHDGGEQAQEACEKMKIFLPELDSIIRL